MSKQFNRTTLATLRFMDYFSEKELVAQSGHSREDWPLVILKELIDNALDACEEAGIPPEINVVVNDEGIQIDDNGPGIPANTIQGMLDYSVRVSSREAYVAPDRGAQGNALKTIMAIPFVLDGNRGRIEIEAKGVRHIIDVTVDALLQTPKIERKTEFSVKKGTSIKVFWPDSARSIITDAKSEILLFVENYGFLNPHLTLNYMWFEDNIQIKANSVNWPKWRPSNPTSAHWYEVDHLSRLIAGYITYDRLNNQDRTVRDFIAEFKGLSSTIKRKAVLDETGFGQKRLISLTNEEGIISEAIKSLLESMRKHSDPVKCSALGIIGYKHIKERFQRLGGVVGSFRYQKIDQVDSVGLPYVLEVAFAWHEKLWWQRRLITGVNWSPGIVNPFRELGYESLESILEQQRASVDDPVMVFVHLVYPRAEYTDRGKSAIILDTAIVEAIQNAVKSVTRTWANQQKKEERKSKAECNRRQVMTRSSTMTLKEVAWEVMETAYLKASNHGQLPANVRQIMYAARPYILERTGNDNLDSKYFTQTLLPDYIRDHSEQTMNWDVVYDMRGHFQEPHTGVEIGLGTLRVRHYLQSIRDHVIGELCTHIGDQLYPTVGPDNRYSAILFIEKEGFMPLFKAVELAERYDLAIMSTKGMSVTAARHLVDKLCHDRSSVSLLVLHDFDKAGFSILGTLYNDTDRYKFENRIKVMDLGIRLEDVQLYNLEAEICKLGKSDKIKLKEHGASQDEIDFLSERRVELNAFSSGDFITWIESKLNKCGIKKVMPDDHILLHAYHLAMLAKILNKKIEVMMNETKEIVEALNPLHLSRTVARKLKEKPHIPWDRAIDVIVDEHLRGGDGDDA